MSAVLLPSNRTPLETALDAVDAARYPLPTGAVVDAWDPDTCPLHLLPYLAWALSVDVWDPAWPETTQREVTRNALRLHSLKTTPAGIRAHVALTGGTVKRIIRPPASGFLRGVMDDAARAAWLDGLAQIRIYPFVQRGTVHPRRSFQAGPGARRQFYGARPARLDQLAIGADRPLYGRVAPAVITDEPLGNARFHSASRGHRLLGRRATFYDRGVETEVTLGDIEGDAIERVFLRRTAQARVFHGGGFVGQGFLRASAADLHTVTVRIDRDGPALAVPRGVDPVDVRPQRIAQRRTAPIARSFMGRHGGFLRSSHGPMLIYDRIALSDPERVGRRARVLSWHGHGRYGVPAFTAELKIQVPMRRSPRRSGRWHGVGYRAAADMTPLTRAIEAVSASKAARDTILIDTAVHRPVRFGDGLRFGDFDFGQIREAA